MELKSDEVPRCFPSPNIAAKMESWQFASYQLVSNTILFFIPKLLDGQVLPVHVLCIILWPLFSLKAYCPLMVTYCAIGEDPIWLKSCLI